MTDQPLLSICIPTYNRAGKLQQCLDHIVCQFNNESVKQAIEVVISDNASQDNTEELAASYQNTYGNIKYFKNGENVGIDKNIINSVVKATGQYCWHIGDDDFIQNGSLAFIIDFLSKKEVDLLTVDFHPFIDVRKSLTQDHGANETLISYSNTPEEFYQNGHCQGILGIFIFNRGLWLTIDRANYEEFWSYYEIILRMLPAAKMKFAHLNYPVLFVGQDYTWSKGGTALFTAIHIKRLLGKLKKFGYSEKFINKEVDRFAKSLPMALLTAKAAGLKNYLGNLWMIYKEIYQHPLTIVFTTILFFIPNSFIRTFKKIKNLKKIIKYHG